jgi:FKBP-type peptidyl-prolyl cis-trans isomerase
MKLKGGAYEISDQCLAIFRNPQIYGLNPDDYANLNFEEFAKNKVGGGYKKKVKKETKKKETKKKETKKKETKKKETKKKETKKKETKKKETKKKEKLKKKVTKKKVNKTGGGVLGDYVKSLQ